MQAHPFSKFIRIIARGPTLSRPLTEEEMVEATRLILSGNIRPEQLGAFLCVLRVRTEDPGETAGFVRAVKEQIVVPENAPSINLDWSSYAGKKRHLPWFLLSALLLARNGIKIFMHGTEGHTPGRIYSREALESIGVAHANSMADAADKIRETNFAYLPLQYLSQTLQDIMDLKPVLGVRTPLNTFARMLNPFNASHTIQSIFHPNYAEIHRETAHLLKQPNLAVYKGEGGEVERRPHKPIVVMFLRDGTKTDETWPPITDIKVPKETDVDLSRLSRVWQGEDKDPIAISTIQGTAAIALRLLGQASNPDDAQNRARDMWDKRPATPY